MGEVLKLALRHDGANRGEWCCAVLICFLLVWMHWVMLAGGGLITWSSVRVTCCSALIAKSGLNRALRNCCFTTRQISDFLLSALTSIFLLDFEYIVDALFS